MKKLAKVLGSKSVIVAFLLDVLGILVSFLVDVNLTNAMLERVVFMLYCIRYELIVFLIILIIGVIYSYILRRYQEERRAIAVILFVPLLAALTFSAPILKRYAIGRYIYFKRELYQYESQKKYINCAVKDYTQRRWDESVQYVNKAQDLYSNCVYANRIGTDIKENTTMVNAFCNQLYNIYIKPDKSHITYSSFQCSRTLSLISPQKYSSLYSENLISLKNAIIAYDQLYEAVQNDDCQKSKELIDQYGWCWFEPALKEKILSSKGQTLSSLHQYIENEQCFDAQERIAKYWLGSNWYKIFEGKLISDEDVNNK